MGAERILIKTLETVEQKQSSKKSRQPDRPVWQLARSEQAEWLDLGFGSPGDIQTNFNEMSRINRFLGGDRALFQHLLPRLKQHAAPVKVLDLGTGSASLLARLQTVARQNGIALSAWGLDASIRNLASAACVDSNDAIQGNLVCGDALALPFAPQSADYLISSLVLHHFSPAALISLLRSARQVAARGMVMSDLVRGWLPLAGFRLVQPLLARHPMTRHDGALSVRRAYQPEELLEIALAAGLPKPRVFAHFPWRMTLVVDL